MIALLAACADRQPLVDEARELTTLELGERHLVFRATLRGWRYGGGWGPDGPQLPHDAVYVGWEIDVDGTASLKGETGQVWPFDALADGRARYDGLRVETCADAEHAGFRIVGGDEPRVRVIVPDRAGAAVGMGASEDCAAELAGIGPSDEWRRDRSAGRSVCEHLYRLGLRQDAVRCELREPLRGGTKLASRQDLGSAPDDPRYVTELLAALAPDAPGDRSTYAPYRVGQLLTELDKGSGVEELARQLVVAPERSAWRAMVVAAGDARDGLAWVDDGVDTVDRQAIAEILLRTFPDEGRIARVRGTPPAAECAPAQQVEPGRCPDLGAL